MCEIVKDNGNKATNDFDDLLYDLRAELTMLKTDENRLFNEVTCVLNEVGKNSDDEDFVRTFGHSTARFNNEIESLGSEVEQLSSNLKVIHGLADNISSRVLTLDTARGRVVECLQLVSDLRDLRTCAEGVRASMEQEEFDEAARHVHRFFALDSEVFKMSDQLDSNDSHQSMKQCYETLYNAAADLKIIIEAKFDEARRDNDFASMERFFKLFPLINEHSSGLERFSNYLCSKIQKLGDENFKILQAGGTNDQRKNVMYADTLMLIFESIARLIELHQPLIAYSYGADKLLLLLELIQPECDKQTIRIVDAFIQKRHIEYKARQVDNYLRNGSITDKIDPLELDVLLSEITLMHTRAEFYCRFLKRRLGNSAQLQLSPNSAIKLFESTSTVTVLDKQMTTVESKSTDKQIPSDHTLSTLPEVEFFENYSNETLEQRRKAIEKLRDERNKKLDSLLNRSALNLKMQEILDKYVLMEQYYMIESVKKAMEMDDVEEGSLTSTISDDVFFIVRKSIRRSISSLSVDCICAMLNNGVTLLETEFIKHINAPIRAGYPSSGWTAEAYQTAQTAYNALQQKTNVVGGGGSGSGGATNQEGNTVEKQKNSFLIALNNLRVTIECIGTLRIGLNDDFERHLIQISSHETRKLENSVAQLDDLCKKLEYYVNLGISKLCEAAFRSKIKASAEIYLDIPHILTDDQLSEYEAIDPFIEMFIAQLDKQIISFEDLLVSDSYQALIMEVCVEALHQMERCICKCAFNRLGGLQLDKEYRQLTFYFTSIVGWSIREKCFRLAKIVALLNSESFEEAIEFLQQNAGNNSSSDTFLTLDEIKKVLMLRTEFPRDKIKQLRF